MFIGAGVYREVVTVAMTSAVAETFVIGDTSGEFTGDAGEVIWTNYLNGWHDTPSASDVLNLAQRDFLTFRNISFSAGAAGSCIDGSTAHSSNITIDQCVLVASGSVNTILTTATFATALAWTITRSIVACFGGNPPIALTLTTGAGADYDANVQITDSLLWAVGNPPVVSVTNSGTAANKGGGVDVLRCTIVGFTGLATTAAQLSTTIPCTIQDTLLLCQINANAGTAGQIVDLGGNVGLGSFTNISGANLHATTKTGTDDFPAPLVSFAHEWMWGMQPRRFLAPLLPDVLNRGTIGTATTDMEGRARPEGIGRFIDSGTATTGSPTTLTDSGKAWATNEHAGRLVRITGGTASGGVKHIASNTATVLTTGTKSGDWATTPDATSTYVIYEGPPTETAKATSGSTTTFVVSTANWSVNKWAGYSLEVTAGTQNGTTRTIASNNATTLTTAAFPGAIDSTSVGAIYWPGTSVTATQRTPGALELHDDEYNTAVLAADAGDHLEIHGPGSRDFLIPVDASATVLTVKVRWDANHGDTTKPQAILLANGEIGVATETETATGTAGSAYETMTFSSFTPTAKGVVSVRLVSRSATPYGIAAFDTFA